MSRRAAGFTLVEVAIAVTVAALLLSAVYGVFASVSGARERLQVEGEGYHRARVLFDRLGRELRGAYLRADRPETHFSGGIDEAGEPFLEFSTSASSPVARGAGIAVVRYSLADDPDDPDGGGRVLLRSEQPLVGSGEEPRRYRLAAGIEELRLRFYDGGSWQEEWQEGLPQAVEVNLTLRAGEAPVSFVSAVELPALEVR